MEIKTIPLSDRSVRLLPPFKPKPGSKSRCDEYSDSSLPGFKVQVYGSGGKHFVLRFTLDGRKGSISIGEFPYMKTAEARERALNFKSMVARGEDPRIERAVRRAMPTLEEFCVRVYLPWAYQSKKTADDDESKLRHYVFKIFGRCLLDSIDRRSIEEFLGELLKTLKPASVNRFRSLFSRIFSLAIEHGVLGSSPMTFIKKFREPDFRPTVLSPDQTRQLLASLAQDENRIAATALSLLILTGCRREEILGAKWQQLDLDQGSLLLTETKNGHSRLVQLSPPAIEALRRIDPVPGSPWIFNGRTHGTRLSDPRKCLWRALDRAGLPRIRIHALRHGFGTMAINAAGLDVATVQKLLGHREIQTTLKYARLEDSTLRTATNHVAGLLVG